MVDVSAGRRRSVPPHERRADGTFLRRNRKDLASLSAILGPDGSSDVKTADSGYARFNENKKKILRLSRQNTNVRSLAISLNQKRTAVLMCQDALAALEKLVRAEPVSDATPDIPR